MKIRAPFELINFAEGITKEFQIIGVYGCRARKDEAFELCDKFIVPLQEERDDETDKPRV